MKLKLLNIISIVCFFVSSLTILFVPLMDFNNGFPVYAYYIAGTFWALLFSGIVIQIILILKTRNIKPNKSLKKLRIIDTAVLLISIIMMFIVVNFLKSSSLALPINLFVLLISIESYSVICGMEKLL